MPINYNHLKSKVEDCLKKDEQSRNSDIRLYNFLITNFPIYVNQLIKVNGEYNIPLNARYSLPKEEDVCRIRRKFNSNKKYLPTNPEVIRQRRLNEIEWCNEMSPSNPSLF